MNKEELIAAIAEKSEFSKVDTKKFLDAYTEVVTKALSKGDSVQLVGFSTLSVIAKPARKGRNPRTGAEIKIAASKAVKFAVGKQLKDAVNS
jgi:DNA-binding protein HU-beta